MPTTPFQKSFKKRNAVLDEAMDAFWAVVARRYPSIKSGDFSADAATAFEDACYEAMTTWLMSNDEPLRHLELFGSTFRMATNAEGNLVLLSDTVGGRQVQISTQDGRDLPTAYNWDVRVVDEQPDQ
ncbi:MAG: hypothetical protein E6R08_10065 [Nevskiaceae bacterium]|nr:MAG: hypothetical protein E6R08_10065 [Nevskiaceae bacterium]